MRALQRMQIRDPLGDVGVERRGLRSARIDVQQHLLARRHRAVDARREHLEIQMQPLRVVREHARVDPHARALLDLAQIVDVRFERIDGAAARATRRVVETDRIEQRVGREAEDQQIERVAQVAVVIHPFRAHRVAVNRQFGRLHPGRRHRQSS